jgi:predicted acetyltransferase
VSGAPIELVLPDPAYQSSWLAAADEFLAEGNARYTEVVLPADDCFGGWEWTRGTMADPTAFARMCAERIAQADPDRPRPCDWVPHSTRWVVEGDEFLGSLSLRHVLTPGLRAVGGHIGYSVRPSARGRGVATEGLRLMLPVAAGLGIDPVLVTCDDDNLASARVIERNGGVLEDVLRGKRRYWIAIA